MKSPEAERAPLVKRDLAPIVFTCAVFWYVLRVMGALWRSDLPTFFPDSFSYVEVADIGPFRPEFWFTERPVGTPLLLWLCGSNLHLFFLTQTIIFACSVAALGRVVLDSIRSRVIAWATVAAVSAVAVQPRFGLWHVEVLSESLGLSLGILVIASWLRVALGPTRRSIVLATWATIAWVLTRDVHALLAIPVIVALVVMARARKADPRQRRTLIRAAIGLAVAVLYVVSAQSVSERNQYPLMNNIGLRVLPDETMTESFTDRGMPLSDALAARSGRNTWDDQGAFLNAADLETFRDWVRGSGQITQMTSLVVDADFWWNVTSEAVPSALSYDFVDYDRFGTSDRLPERLFWFDGVRTGTAALILSLLVGAALIAAFSISKRRGTALVLAAASALCVVDMYVSASSDAVEVLRHLVGPVLRSQVVGFIAIGIGLDALVHRYSSYRDGRADVIRRPVRQWTATAVAAGSLGTAAAWVGLENRSQDFDPQYARTIVERAARFGGSYYQNGIHNKGPLETAVYDSARWITSDDGYWFGISAYVILAALVIGSAVWMALRAVGTSRWVAALGLTLSAVHFTVSTSDYAGVLYSRNITVALLAAAFALAMWPRPWRHRRPATITFVVIGILIGAAVQTLLTTAIAGAVLALHVVAERSRSTGLRRPRLVLPLAIGATVASAPAWYALRGSFDEFWSGWWTYARFMSTGTGRGLIDQFALGSSNLLGYYQERPEAVAAIVAFVVVTRVEWPTMTPSRRRLHMTCAAWFAAAWVELVLAQRYSSHYFAVLAVPTLLMAVIAAAGILRIPVIRQSLQPLTRPGARARTAVAACCVLIVMQGTDIVWSGVEGASRFRNVAGHVAERQRYVSGATRTTRAILDLVSTRGDALLAWTMYPWTYLEHERVPATRFIWKSFLIGEIYLGRTSPAYVLPETDRWFVEDLQESKPTTFVRPTETVLVEGTPLDSVLRSFDEVYLGPDVEIRFEKNLWRSLNATSSAIDPGDPASPLDLPAPEDRGAGWIVEDSGNTSVDLEARLPAAPLRLMSTIGSGSCWRLDATMEREAVTSESALRLLMSSANRTGGTPQAQTVHLGVDFTRAWSGEGSERYLEHRLENETDLTLDVSVLIGRQSAALLVDGRIVAAVGLTGPGDVSLEPLSPTVKVRNLRISPVRALYGC